MAARYYADYFTVPSNYTANMTREIINQTPDTWLDFYPHEKYIEFLKTLIQCVASGTKSVWLTGNYGTGKSNAALVTQKLFMDETERVKRWLSDNKSKIKNVEQLEKQLFQLRADKTLIVYDYNASGVGPHAEFIVRLEKAIIQALTEHGYQAPAGANLDAIISRIEREGENFFKTRDNMQLELAHLRPSIKTVDALVTELRQEAANQNTPNHILEDVQKVLHRDDIYLAIDAVSFRKWIKTICDVNGIKQIVFIFDEFSEFIDNNKDQLKTFEDITEGPALSRFFLVPVTHRNIEAFWAENSAGANKAKDRFFFRNLQMPNDTAFQLAAHAMKKIPEVETEWINEKNVLFDNVKSVLDSFRPEDVSRQSFYDILPIHPMAAFLLKFLSESARSNQRSIFEYLKGSADGREFQDFIQVGGPREYGKQYLTVDYLWRYFIERDDLGTLKEITNIRNTYERIRMNTFANKDDSDEDLRVLKTVMLFCLMWALQPEGHERLRPTVENIELCFRGDGAMGSVSNIITSLASKHCFSVVDGNIELFVSSGGSQQVRDKIKEIEGQFYELLSDKAKNAITEKTKSYRNAFSVDRFDIRVTDIGHTNLTNMTGTTRKSFSKKDDDGSICLWFVVAKDNSEQMNIPEKIKNVLQQLNDHRIIFFTFPDVTFCSKNTELWNEYVAQQAQYLCETNDSAKTQIQRMLGQIEKDWTDTLKRNEQKLTVYTIDESGAIDIQGKTWADLKEMLPKYVEKTLPFCPDLIKAPIGAFTSNGLQSWAQAGLTYDTKNPMAKQLVASLLGKGITADESWFEMNPSHPFSAIRALFEKKAENTILRGTPLSVRKVYIELKRYPFGMRYNGLSAFSLGVALRSFLTKNYQWTNNQQTLPLDDKTLSEIIESVVKDDGSDQIKSEKLICRLSKEDKSFIENAPAMFGLNASEDNTVTNVLLRIQEYIQNTSSKVPLWVLADEIRYSQAEDHETISTLLDDVCSVCRISSKGNVEERTEGIRRIGAKLSQDSSIKLKVAPYIQKQNFLSAFYNFVDKEAPELSTLASDISDYSHNYCSSILEKMASTAGTLWNRTDLRNEIQSTIIEYRIIKIIREWLGINGFIKYEDALRQIDLKARSSHFALDVLVNSYPNVHRFFSLVCHGGSAEDIYNIIKDTSEDIQGLLLDPMHKLLIQILQKKCGNGISNEEMLEALKSLDDCYEKTENEYLKQLLKTIEMRAQNSLKKKLQSAWRSYSNSSSPNEWANNSGMPARFALIGFDDASHIIEVILNPDAFSPAELNTTLSKIEGLSAIDLVKCQDAFMKEVIPDRYDKFKIGFASVVNHFRGKYGSNPNEWPQKLIIEDLIRDHYKDEFAPLVVNALSNKNSDEIKQKLIKLAKENPEIGLLFWE